ncbi:hypothetical protein CISIN_1g035238mg [Citrus sinensis]|uniref:Uncharacterized protein n=1 Tax=Citrus sinensis TaxID=2711 RepID=A0A067D2Y4_CITSI|nr:hypothetical protein CISIN_1g035238mg [Citrus sinensis]
MIRVMLFALGQTRKQQRNDAVSISFFSLIQVKRRRFEKLLQSKLVSLSSSQLSQPLPLRFSLVFFFFNS